MPPDGACILTVLKPLQSLTGGSRLDALAKSAPDKSSRGQQPFGSAPRQGRISGVIYICAFVFTPFLTHLMFRTRFFASAIAARAATSSDRLITSFTTTQVTEPKTSTLFFLGTSESTKNRGVDRGSKIEDRGSRIEDRLTRNGAILDPQSPVLNP